MRSFIHFAVVILAFAGCEKQIEVSPISASQWNVFRYLPENTQLLMFIGFENLRQTNHWQQFIDTTLGSNPAGKWLDDFESETGAGIRQGIAEVYTASTWDGNSTTVVLFTKNFRAVSAYFENPLRFNAKEFDGHKIFNMRGKSSSNFCLIDQSILLIANNEEYLLSVLRGEGNSFKNNDRFISIIQQIQFKDHYWIATDNGSYAALLIEKLLSTKKELPAKEILGSIQDISISADFADGVNISSIWKCKDSKNAYLLSAAIRSAIALDLLAGHDKILHSLFDKMEIVRKSDKINFEISLNKKDIEDLQSLAKNRNLYQNL
jgi:hypothetical protein